MEFNSFLRNAPVSSQQSAISNQPKASVKQPDTSGQLDLFADSNSEAVSHPTAEGGLTSNDTIENRLCQYLLNPEVAFNPHIEPNWDALKADTSLWNLYNEVELPLVPVLRDMEKAGVRFDLGLLKEAEQQLTAELTELEQKIYDLAGTTFNVNSPAQVGEILFDRMHLDDKAKKSVEGSYVLVGSINIRYCAGADGVPACFVFRALGDRSSAVRYSR